MARQGSSEGSKRHTVEPSGKTKHREDARRGNPLGSGSEGGEIVRLSPYVRRTAKHGSNLIRDGGTASSVTQTVESSAALTTPKADAPTLGETSKSATTFVDSVLSLCSKSSASCNVISEPAPCGEGIFLYLVSLCGIAEAKYWSEIMGFRYQRSYALLSQLLYGQKLSKGPDVIG